MFAEGDPTHTPSPSQNATFFFIKVIMFKRYLLVRPELSLIWQQISAGRA